MARKRSGSGIFVGLLKLCCIVRLRNGQRVFVKGSMSSLAANRKPLRAEAMHEKTCIEILKGLAVPSLSPIPKRELAGYIRLPLSAGLAMSWVNGAPLEQAGLSPVEIVGAWLHVLEQLTAFRRSGLLYTDVKCLNVMARCKPLSVTIVDFNHVVPVKGSAVYAPYTFGLTARFAAPEQFTEGPQTERSLAYQIGMLLAHCLVGLNNARLRARVGSLVPLRKKLHKMGAGGLTKLVEDCLRSEPEMRPRDYEAVLERVRKLSPRELDPGIVQVWNKLREPFARTLSGLGLNG